MVYLARIVRDHSRSGRLVLASQATQVIPQIIPSGALLRQDNPAPAMTCWHYQSRTAAKTSGGPKTLAHAFS